MLDKCSSHIGKHLCHYNLWERIEHVNIIELLKIGELGSVIADESSIGDPQFADVLPGNFHQRWRKFYAENFREMVAECDGGSTLSRTKVDNGLPWRNGEPVQDTIQERPTGCGMSLRPRGGKPQFLTTLSGQIEAMDPGPESILQTSDVGGSDQIPRSGTVLENGIHDD